MSRTSFGAQNTVKIYGENSSGGEEEVRVHGGGFHSIDGALAVKITASGGNTYVGEALPGTAQATATWRCSKIDSTGTTTWADGNANFDNTATDLTAHSYS